MTQTQSVGPTTSVLVNALLQIIADPGADLSLIASAADLIALDARLNDWFASSAKQTQTYDDLERILELSDRVTDAVTSAWVQHELADPEGRAAVRESILAGCEAFRRLPEPGR
jgi:hypothetical protein